MQVNQSIFRAYGVRGRYPEQINPQLADHMLGKGDGLEKIQELIRTENYLDTLKKGALTTANSRQPLLTRCAQLLCPN